jgi:hypothetical protein
MYAHLEGENVDSFKNVFRDGGDWARALERAGVIGWLE